MNNNDTQVLPEVQNWLDAGYVKHMNYGYNNSDYLLQKRADDDKGKKYFINVWVYEHYKQDYFHISPGLSRVSFSPSAQFQREDKMTLDLSFHFSEENTIEELQLEIEQLWEFLGKPYYDKYEGLYDF